MLVGGIDRENVARGFDSITKQDSAAAPEKRCG